MRTSVVLRQNNFGIGRWFLLNLHKETARAPKESAPYISVKWVYNSDLFDATSIERMVFLYQVAIETITADGGMRLSEIMASLAEADQRHRATENREFQEISLQRLRQIKRRAATRV